MRGVVLIHYMVGWDAAIKKTTRKLAYNGLATIAANMHFRAGEVTSQENSVSVRESGGMPDDRRMGDVQGAMQHLRGLPYVDSNVGFIGFGIGGRLVYLGACILDNVDAAVDCGAAA
ncbi:MAG: dienelactone hydrolase family protein [Dehalococcoidia bacterium]|nr:dienelactone hydrolase family protein [Dehalococcoidia bacterium]